MLAKGTQEEVEEQIRLKLDRAQHHCYEHLKRQYTSVAAKSAALAWVWRLPEETPPALQGSRFTRPGHHWWKL